ncbi:MAG: hypothetical protein KDA89_25315 [Planctomycetaceae bacterium]|nr:hypothetical protein [Planctomycetaceae bacterium]
MCVYTEVLLTYEQHHRSRQRAVRVLDHGHLMAIQDATNHTKIRAIRVNDELWNLFRQCAEANEETASEAIRNLMQDYIDETTML